MENNIENHKLFKVNQNAVIQNDSREILILKKDGKWMLPGGRLEEGEDWLRGLKREVREETGIENFEVREILNVDTSDSLETYIVTFLCKVKNVPEINLSHEHEDYAWIKQDAVNSYTYWHDKIRERLQSLFLRL